MGGGFLAGAGYALRGLSLLRAPGLGLTREEGQVRAVLLQPFGPEAADGTRPSLQLDFMLPLESAG